MAEFTISDVVRIHNIHSKKKGSEQSFMCPTCRDDGACTFSPSKGSWHCWKCDAGGGPIELHIAMTTDAESIKRYNGDDGKKKAARDIFKALEGDTVYDSSLIKNATIKEVNEADKASDEHCSRVYKALLEHCSLDAKHKDRLLNRGLSEEQIVRFGFKSVPNDTKALSRQLLRKGYVLEGVPGFYLNHGDWDLKTPYNYRMKQKETGTFCPVIDGERNFILGFQVNVDKPKDWDKLSKQEQDDYAKYLWISSKGKEKGVTSGSIATFLPGKDNSGAVIFTEGILKATVIYCLLSEQVSVVGVPGIGLFKSAIPYLDRFSAATYAYTAYDMDKEFTKGTIYLKDLEDPTPEQIKYLRKIDRLNAANLELKSMIMEYGFGVHELKWDIDQDGIWNGEYKGLDDFLKCYERKDLFLKYIQEKSIKEILEKKPHQYKLA